MLGDRTPTTTYLSRLTSGDVESLLASFLGEPSIDDPLSGPVRGEAAVARFLAEKRAWLAERGARIEPVRVTRRNGRTVFETLVALRLGTANIELPVGVVGDEEGERVRALRVYHSLWPLEGAHRVRPPILSVDHRVTLSGSVADYQRALAAGDAVAIVETFEPDGYFREPAGGEYVFRGRARLQEFMSQILGTGGIALEHCTVTDDGVACAIEFNAVRFGPHTLQPQAGLAVYERGRSGKLCAARVYDDVNVEALLASEPKA